MQHFTMQWKKKKALEKAGAIKTFLQDNYQENITGAFLAKKFGMNTRDLRIAFKELTNENVHAYLTKIRIEQAKKLLQKTDLHVSLIAARVGLDKTNLYIHFKKLTGVTPAQWREDALQNKETNYYGSLTHGEENNTRA